MLAGFMPQLLLAQSKVVSGTVKNEAGEAMSGVSVVAKGAAKGTSSATDGSFSLQVPASTNTVVFSIVIICRRNFPLPIQQCST